jgi:hypothetical protein
MEFVAPIPAFSAVSGRANIEMVDKKVKGSSCNGTQSYAARTKVNLHTYTQPNFDKSLLRFPFN